MSALQFDSSCKLYKIAKLSPVVFLQKTLRRASCLRAHLKAEVAELADARGSGPRTRKGVGVRVPSSAPIS